MSLLKDNEYFTIYTKKNGLFSSEKFKINLMFNDNNITGSAIKVTKLLSYVYQEFDIEYDTIVNYEICDFEKTASLKIEAYSGVDINKNELYDTYIFPFESAYNLKDILQKLQEYKNKYEVGKQQMIEYENEKMRLRQEKENQRNLEIKEFFNNIYNFHISQDTPIYPISQKGTNCFVMFIAKDKSINFLLIEAETKTELHTVIEYDKIHYYEKAGTIHFATNINADYKGGQLFGGSFVGAKVSTGAIALGGLLLGSMGMAIGAASTYKPAEYIPPQYTPSSFNISSEITKIDERSVVLNFYSEQHKQYIDIELPQEMYNFLQTYLPEKKYAIVIEKEKQAAISNTQNATISNNTATNSIEDTSIQRLQKLKQLYEMELITEAEYIERKKEILAEI